MPSRRCLPRLRTGRDHRCAGNRNARVPLRRDPLRRRNLRGPDGPRPERRGHGSPRCRHARRRRDPAL